MTSPYMARSRSRSKSSPRSRSKSPAVSRAVLLKKTGFADAVELPAVLYNPPPPNPERQKTAGVFRKQVLASPGVRRWSYSIAITAQPPCDSHSWGALWLR